MGGTIFIINPNSSEAITAGIDEAVNPLRIPGGPKIACVTVPGGPAGIQTQRDVESVIGPMLAKARELEDEASAFVVACFSDPGLHALREQSRHPVLGILESGVLTAMTLGHRFGVIAILPTSIPRHLRYLGAMGVMQRFAGDLSIGMGVAELADEARTRERLTATGRALRDNHGADVVVMGCAGMARFRRPLEDALGIPVVEPTQAAAAMAVGRVLLNSEL